jgi:TolB-like protein/Tfp pilus assembly protein PilF
LKNSGGQNVFIDADNAVNTAIRKIRRALRDDPDRPRLVQTVSGKGYRFIGQVDKPSARLPAPIKVLQNHRESIRRTRKAWKSVIPWAAAATAGFVLAGYLLRPHLLPQPTGAYRRVMLAVLPFENLSNDPDQEYFSDGLTEETITDLGQLSPERLGVIARTSAMAFKHSGKSANQIGQELGVEYLVEGSVRRQGERVRVTAQLIRVKDQTHIWAQSYDREIREFLELQNELGRAIAGQVQVRLTPQQKLEHSRTPRVNSAAHDDYLRGLSLVNTFRTGEVKKSINFFQSAIQEAPGYAQPYTGLSLSYALLGDYGELPPTEAYLKSEAAARKAVELDSGSSQAHSALGWQLLSYDRDWAGSEEEFQRAMELDPSNADAHQGFAMHLAARGHFDDATAEITRAQNLDPFSPIVNMDRARVLFYERKYDQAKRQLQAGLNLEPNFPGTHWMLVKIYEGQGDYEEAFAEECKANGVVAENPGFLAQVQEIHSRFGWKSARQKVLSRMLDARSKGRFATAYDLAEASMVLGHREQALSWLQKAADEHHSQVIFVSVDPRFDALRSDPKFQNLARDVGLPP